MKPCNFSADEINHSGGYGDHLFICRLDLGHEGPHEEEYDYIQGYVGRTPMNQQTPKWCKVKMILVEEPNYIPPKSDGRTAW